VTDDGQEAEWDSNPVQSRVCGGCSAGEMKESQITASSTSAEPRGSAALPPKGRRREKKAPRDIPVRTETKVRLGREKKRDGNTSRGNMKRM